MKANTEIKLHRGKCSNCPELDWIMCYRLPVNINFKINENREEKVEIGKHIDLCFACIAREFEIRNK